MKLHFHPGSTTSRTIMLFCAEAKIDYEPVVVDIMTGAHHQEPFVSLNPSRQVPVLEDGDFVLTESSAILKYLADKVDSPAYPKDLKKRARVNERMDWLNTNYYREWGYHLIYPQVFPHHVREPAAGQEATIAWGKVKSEEWLKLLDEHVIGDHAYLCGDRDHHRRLLRRRAPFGGRPHRRDLPPLPEHRSLAAHHARPAELEQGQRGADRLRRVPEGQAVRHDPVNGGALLRAPRPGPRVA